MKKLIYLLLLAFTSVWLTACTEDYLDIKDIEADVSVEELYTRYSYVQGVVWGVYNYLPDGLNTMMLEAATDVAESTHEGSASQLFNNGAWNQFMQPDYRWSDNFRGIYQANLYLENHGEVDLEHIKANSTETDSSAYFNAKLNVELMEGEVLFLKAYFYFELIKRYGGVPILEHPIDYEDKDLWSNIERNSLDDCVKYIVELCDRAAEIVPLNVTQNSWYQDGRVTHVAIKALRARTLLFAASPLFKEAGTTTTWAEAAAAAHEVLTLNSFLHTNYAALFSSANATNREIIFKRRYGSINWFERNQFPISFTGSNGAHYAPTQNFVDQFEVVSGSGASLTSVDFDWDNPVHAANPYDNRDPRFNAIVLHNNRMFKNTLIETFIGGNNGLPRQNASKTGYYLNKWISTNVDLVNNTNADKTWIYFRTGEFFLNYAEAMYNAYGAGVDPEGYGMTAIQAYNLIRNRAKVRQLLPSELNQERIERERMIELSFEDHRFWDVRRWKKGVEYFGEPVNRIVITKDGADFSYAVEKLEDRVFTSKMHWYPIPQSEIDNTGWQQNPDW